MADRRRQILQLLASRYDGLYLPPGALTTAAGFVPQQLEPCGDCGGTGRQRDRYGRPTKCARCHGRGRLAYDPMDAQHAPVGSRETVATARPRATVRCDACNGDGAHGNGHRCTVCGGAGRRDLHAFELHLDQRDQSGDPMTDAIERRNQSGSYAELDRALAGIRVQVNKPLRYRWITDHATRALRLIDEVTLAGRDEATLEPEERVLFDACLAYIEQRMPDPIRVPAQVAANGREQAEWRRRVKGRGTSPEALKRRDAEIRQAIRRGVPTQRVAFEYGLSVAQVNRIVAGEAA